MQYDIRLRIDYAYHAPSDHARTVLRLMPQDMPGQRVLTAGLSIDPPPDERQEGRDFFGNRTTALAWHEPVDHITLVLRSRIERLVQPQPEAILALEDLPSALATEGIGPGSPHHFLAPSPRIPPDPAIAAFTRAAARGADTVLALAEAAGKALHGDMRFDPGATEVDTPPSAAFAARRGVCQDYAQILICGLRAAGVPAAYVSGLIRTNPPPGQPRLAGVDAMHAWVAVWVGTGWVGYDPTNACPAGADHLALAWGRDYADAAPVRGALRSAGGQDSRQAVDVVPVSAPAARLRRKEP